MSQRFEVDPPGPLAFPITPFDAGFEVDLGALQGHLAWLLEHRPPALFVACGTGEFASLDVGELGALTRAAVEVAGAVPVYCGAGGPLPLAKGQARAAEEAGAAGLLVLPPYLIAPEQAGLVAYYTELARSTSLPLILYQRDNAVFEPTSVVELARLANVVGFKDGLGDPERMQRIVRAVGGALTYFNGLPTAEASQVAYRALGVNQYSSAVFNFVPEVSWAFFDAVSAGEDTRVGRILDEFFIPLTDLRRLVRGYAVTLVKAGTMLRRGVHPRARPPLVEVAAEHLARLEGLLERGLELAAG